MYYPYDPTMIFLIPAMILAMVAQMKVKSTFNRFMQVANQRGLTGADVARDILSANGLSHVPVVQVGGSLSDHYDPRNTTVHLSPEVFSGRSIASVSVAAHEVGHAIQHAELYKPMTVRALIFPAVNLSSNAAVPLAILGLVLGFTPLIDIGIILFTIVVAFHMVTLPVEFNASSRAIAQLVQGGFIYEEEKPLAKKVLSAAAMTYVAAAAVAVMQLVRLIILRGRRD
jgi:Zn-dependent membrane protease YugP